MTIMRVRKVLSESEIEKYGTPNQVLLVSISSEDW